MDKTNRIRILNKTSKDVTLKLGDKSMTFPWEEFNKKLIVVDKIWAVPNEEEQKRQDEAENLVNEAVACVLIQNGNSDPVTKMTHIGALPGIIDKLSELLECSRLEVMTIIRKRLMVMSPFMVNPMFSDETLRKNGIHHKKKHDRKPSEGVSFDENGNRKVVVVPAEKPTLGDAFSCLGELKDKLEKES